MKDHKCTLLNAYIPVEYQQVDSGICIEFRRKLYTLFMLDGTHPRTMQYFKSSNMRRQEQIRHITNHPWVIHPFSKVALYWEFTYFILFTFIMFVICITLMSKEGNLTRGAMGILVIDLFILCDIVKNFFTGYYHEKMYGTILKPQLIVFNYLKTYFIVDFLTVMATLANLFYVLVWNHSSITEMHDICVYFYLLRIFRVPRCCVALDLWRKYFNMSSNVSGIGIVAYRYVMVILWMYGLVYFVDNFVETYILIRPSRIHQFGVLTTFLAFTRLILNRTYGIDLIFHPLDFVIAVIFVAVAYGLHLYLYCEVMQAYRRFSHARSQNDTLLEHFKAYVQYKGLPVSLRKTFFQYFRFKYQHEYFNETRINEILSKNLREEIQVHISRDHIKKVQFLRHIPPHVLTQLVARMKMEIYLANDTIVVAGVPGNCMYFIHYGTVAVYTPSGREMCHLRDGAHFGEIALIYNEPRVASVVAVTPCELFVLRRSDFTEVINLYPKSKKKVINMANNRLAHMKSNI